MEELSLLYKVIVLSLLSRADEPLPGDMISNFFTENDYTDYISGQDALGTLVELGYITQDKEKKFSLTGLGNETRLVLMDKMHPGTEEDIKEFLRKNNVSLKELRDVSAVYDSSPDGAFICALKYQNDGRTLIDLSLRAETKEQAENICLNFKARYDDVFFSLTDLLTE